MAARKIIQAIMAASSRNPEEVRFLGHFFRTGPGQYGEGDQFIGVRVPRLRSICKPYRQLPPSEIEALLESPIHEIRLAGAIIMAEQAKRGDGTTKKALYDLYLRRTDRINNWDIVDSSCRDVVGGYLMGKPRNILYELARSKNIWERRIAIVSTWEFIRHGELDDTFAIAALLLGDRQDLIHKAVGWMLREAGKRDEAELRRFLDAHAKSMPRTALRYSLERLDSESRAIYMKKV